MTISVILDAMSVAMIVEPSTLMTNCEMVRDVAAAVSSTLLHDSVGLYLKTYHR